MGGIKLLREQLAECQKAYKKLDENYKQAIETLKEISNAHHTEGGDMQNNAISLLESHGITVYADEEEKQKEK